MDLICGDFSVEDLGLRVCCSGLGVYGLVFSVEGFGFRGRAGGSRKLRCAQGYLAQKKTSTSLGPPRGSLSIVGGAIFGNFSHIPTTSPIMSESRKSLNGEDGPG